MGIRVQTFRLVPFSEINSPGIDITGEIERTKNQLSIHYKLSGEVDQIKFPDSSVPPSRKDELWKSTCFEFFMAIEDQPQYWEFNLSPSGDWNVYAMDAYRRVGFREETRIPQLPFDFEQHNHECSLDVSADLNPILPANQTVQIGITAVIQSTDGGETYWALAHPGQQADFHLRGSFIISL